MTCMLAIGMAVKDSLAPAMQSALNATRFTAIEEVRSDYVQQLALVGQSLNPNTSWYLATNQEGTPDLSIAYDLPTNYDGRLGVVIRELLKQPEAVQIEVLIFDLGTNEIQKYGNLAMNQIECVLRSWYSAGAPICTVYHRFVRD